MSTHTHTHPSNHNSPAAPRHVLVGAQDQVLALERVGALLRETLHARHVQLQARRLGFGFGFDFDLWFVGGVERFLVDGRIDG